MSREQPCSANRSFPPCTLARDHAVYRFYYLKRVVGFGSILRTNENRIPDKKLYGSLDQRDERSVMA
eukprot:630604-Prymnesium_polylepis.1